MRETVKKLEEKLMCAGSVNQVSYRGHVGGFTYFLIKEVWEVSMSLPWKPSTC
jgi:hypothetical protein